MTIETVLEDALEALRRGPDGPEGIGPTAYAFVTSDVADALNMMRSTAAAKEPDHPVTASDFAAISWARGIGERVLTARVVDAARALAEIEGFPSPRETELQALVDALAALDEARGTKNP